MRVSSLLRDRGFGPAFGTPCGVLAPLWDVMDSEIGVHSIPREDNAVGVAAGVALSGGRPIVLMQNSGFGQSINAIASLVLPYRIPLLFVISLRGIAPDNTSENHGMGLLTQPICELLGITTVVLTDNPTSWTDLQEALDTAISQRQSLALLVPPDAFGWQA